MSDEWRCPRCGSKRWVAASLTGPRMYGGRGIPQCVPCGHYDTATDVEPLEEARRAERDLRAEADLEERRMVKPRSSR